MKLYIVGSDLLHDTVLGHILKLHDSGLVGKQINSVIPLWWALPLLKNNIRTHDTTFIWCDGAVISQYIQLLIRLTPIYDSFLSRTFVFLDSIPYFHILFLFGLDGALIKFHFHKLIEHCFFWPLNTIDLPIIANGCICFDIKNNILLQDDLVLLPDRS